MVSESLKSEVGIFLTRSNMYLLPLAGIFGANASGKSNLIKAIAFFQGSVTNPNSLNQPSTIHPLLKPYLLDKKTFAEPSFFEIVLWDREEKKEYKYGFEISSKRIESEWLEVTEKVNKKFVAKTIFYRNGNEFKIAPGHKKALGILTDKVLPTAPAVYVFAQFAHAQSVKLVNLVDQLVVIDGTRDVTVHSLQKLTEDPVLKDEVRDFLLGADISLKDFDISKEEVPQNQAQAMPIQLTSPDKNAKFNLVQFEVSTMHTRKDGVGVKFNLHDHESLGTQRLFGFAAFILQVLKNGQTIFIDEFANSMHPFISAALLKLFQNVDTNPNGAQLIFVTHDTYLLTDAVKLRRDQVWFAEKNKDEESKLIGLAEYRTRSDLNIEKNYLEGRFGGVPITTFRNNHGL